MSEKCRDVTCGSKNGRLIPGILEGRVPTIVHQSFSSKPIYFEIIIEIISSISTRDKTIILGRYCLK